MKIKINTDDKEIKILVDNTNVMEILDILFKFDGDEWEDYNIIVDSEETRILIDYPINNPFYQVYPYTKSYTEATLTSTK
jgi:hypothetical protein